MKDTNTATGFLGHFIKPYEISEFFLTKTGSHCVKEFSETLCGFLEVKHMTTPAYRPHADRQVEEHNKTTRALTENVAEQYGNWDIYFQPLTYAYKTQWHWSIWVSPFSLALRHHPHETATLDFPSVIPSNVSGTVSPCILGSRLLSRLPLMREDVDRRLASAQ